MKLKIRDMEAETDKVVENNFLDLLEISTEFGEEEGNQLFQWVCDAPNLRVPLTTRQPMEYS